MDAKMIVNDLTGALKDISEMAVRRGIKSGIQKEMLNIENTIKKQFQFNQMKPYLCPVCCGKGIVPAGFYNFPSNCGSITSTWAETCRACNGKGIIIA